MSRRKILVIDDEPFVLSTLVDLLGESGYEVLAAQGGQIGLELFEREHPELVLTDMRMPEVNGLEVIARVKALSPGTPVVVLSGAGESEEEALAQGAAASIGKPILDPDELVRCLEEL
jgi:CheY-like chemotaxis protein